MAGCRFTVSASNAVAASTAETLLQIVAASNHRVMVNRITVTGLPSSTSEAKCRVRVLKQTTAGTSSSATIVKVGDWQETVQTTALQSFSAEPTASDVYYDNYFSLWGDTVIPITPFPVPGGTRLGVELTAGSGSNPTIRVTIDGEE